MREHALQNMLPPASGAFGTPFGEQTVLPFFYLPLRRRDSA